MRDIKIELHKPTFDELKFREDCMSDSNTMSYNAGYDVSYEGYHRDTGCIDFPKSKWGAWIENKLRNPNFFYAYIKDIKKNMFVGYVNFNKNPETKIATMGIVVKSEFRGHGYMRPAIEQLIEKAKEYGVICLTDTVPENRQSALNVFYSLGFVKTRQFVGKKFGNDEIVAVIEKRLIEMK